MTYRLISLSLIASSVALGAPKMELKGDATKGAETFKTYCAVCHGVSGKGDGPAGIALKPTPADYSDPVVAKRLTDEHVYNVIKNGGASVGRSPLMAAWGGTLKDQDVRNVAAFVQKLKTEGMKKAKK